MKELSLPIPLVLFTLAYMLAATVTAFVSGNGEFVFYLVVMVVLISAVVAVRKIAGLSDGLLWALTIWGAMHMAGGLVPVPESWPYNGDQAVLYSLWLIPDFFKYDHLTHFYGFAVTTWACWQGLRNSVRRRHDIDLKPTFGIMVLCAAGGMGFGALNEVVEFAATLSLESTNVGGYINTGWDLVANLAGCSLAAAIIWAKGAGDSSES